MWGRRREPKPIAPGDVTIEEDGTLITSIRTLAAMFSGDYPTPDDQPARPVVVIDLTGYEQTELRRRNPQPHTTRYILEAASAPTVIEHLTNALAALENMQRNQETP